MTGKKTLVGLKLLGQLKEFQVRVYQPTIVLFLNPRKILKILSGSVWNIKDLILNLDVWDTAKLQARSLVQCNVDFGFQFIIDLLLFAYNLRVVDRAVDHLQGIRV